MPRRSSQNTNSLARGALVVALVSGAAPAGADDAPPAKPTAPPRPDPADVLPPRPREDDLGTRPTARLLPLRRAEAALAWERHVEFGPDLAFVSQPGSRDASGQPTGMSYGSAFGFAAHASWPMLRYLQLSLYFFNSNHAIHAQPGALGLPGQITTESVSTYAFGARLQPMLPLGPRARAWLSAGVGWQRFNFPRMEVNTTTPACPVNTYGPGCYLLYDRANSMAQFPVGAGAMFEIVPRWLAIQVEFTAAIPAWQTGTAVDDLRTVDSHGHNVVVGGLPNIDLSLIETIGLSLIL